MSQTENPTVAPHETPAPHVAHQAASSAAVHEGHRAPLGEDHGEGGGHDAGPAQYLMPHEIPNIATLIESVVNPKMAQAHAGVRPEASEEFHVGPVPVPINPLFSIVYAILIVWVVRRALRRASIERPGKLQNLVELLMGGLRNFFVGVMGPAGEKYLPYVGSLWLFILVNNLAGLIPGLKSPTSSFKITVALGLCTFCYVQFHAIKESGLGGWFYHLMGSPTDAITWCLVPLFLVLHVMGELIKPVSLSLRLFGNLFGEDKLLASFLGMGMMIVGAILGTAHPPVGIPLQVIFFPLAMLTSAIQATVFALLASIYIVLLLPHPEHDDGHGHEAHKEKHHEGGEAAGAAERV